MNTAAVLLANGNVRIKTTRHGLMAYMNSMRSPHRAGFAYLGTAAINTIVCKRNEPERNHKYIPRSNCAKAQPESIRIGEQRFVSLSNSRPASCGPLARLSTRVCRRPTKRPRLRSWRPWSVECIEDC
jgi:hypothetical protein